MDEHSRNRSGGIRVAGLILVLVGLAFAVYGSLFFHGWLMYRHEDPNHDATLKLVFGVVSWIIAVVIVGLGVAMKPWRREA
jgi:purine-cytosine permease-like protein